MKFSKHEHLNFAPSRYYDPDEVDGMRRCYNCHEVMPLDKFDQECTPKGYYMPWSVEGKREPTFVLCPFIPLMM